MHPKGTEVYLLTHSQSDICLEKTYVLVFRCIHVLNDLLVLLSGIKTTHPLVYG